MSLLVDIPHDTSIGMRCARSAINDVDRARVEGTQVDRSLEVGKGGGQTERALDRKERAIAIQVTNTRPALDWSSGG